ncbi:DddA-like double-stranded DNA deaminase toxin [Streptomyces caniscabiei]|uniref:SCP1.201-like deaminase n=1 Tax=Streptomyces caniscabiei TaxID=2746961 RepID=A0ABU4MEW1_9ACTN|nr:DddA-like double-stranded DNA deaminase toxin [Streptomyces caniscabiei]MBE4736255.1 sugar-binding protein [Streptomyces caniscabiei]MBE4755617.1 sugar-binding protein [Streptomyces caniscabiei]MBE4774285.1 sugar-binding protein [Streptomyces caniscabiei]MBE4785778.1 sugar-binding protein [Streptomyces caniscabiei]MBE4793799.1 sugar-binding protein [Streptomyces caniscabiei]
MAALDHTRVRIRLRRVRLRRFRFRAALVGTVATALIIGSAPATPAGTGEARPAAAAEPDTSDPREGWRPASELAEDEDDPGLLDRLFGDDEDDDEIDRGDGHKPPRIGLDRSRGSSSLTHRGVTGEAGSVRIAAPRTTHSTGADLSWSAYRGKDLREYEVHRATKKDFTPTDETLLAPVDRDTRTFADRTAPPALHGAGKSESGGRSRSEGKGEGRTYHYRIVVRTQQGKLLAGPARTVELPPPGKVTEGAKLLAAPEDETYFLPYTPARMIPGEKATVEATLTNTTDTVWKKGERVLSYRWTLDGKDVTNLLNKDATGLPEDVAPGEAVTFDAELKAPVLVDPLDKRLTFGLEWDLREKATGDWLSETDGVPPSKHQVTAEYPTSDQLGLEDFHSYAGKNTGAGSALMSNLHAGNAVWSYNAFSNPSLGFSTFLRLAYNSQDASSTPAGYGWSLQASSPVRLGTPLDFHPAALLPKQITLTDGDGTSHVFSKNKKGEWDSPAGVHFRVRQLEKDCLLHPHQREAWEFLRPDRTRFLFDCQGYPSAQVDKNGNRMEFTYEERLLGHPSKLLKYVTDAEGRRTLTVEYWEKGEAYSYVDKDGEVKEGKHLLNPFIVDKVRSVTDVSGRRVDFTFTEKGLLARLTDGANAAEEKRKVFTFRYGKEFDHPGVKLVQVTDPRGNSSKVDYVGPHDDKDQLHYLGYTKTVTDRLGGVTKYRYEDPDGHDGKGTETVVTDAEGNPSTQRMDGYGRPVKLTDAKKRTTRLGWDADNNVTRLEENNGAARTWKYDPRTGYPLEIRDAESVKNDRPAATLTYATGENGYIADLARRVSPEGRTWQFGYDARGNMTSVTDPKGVASEPADDYTSTNAYDARGRLLSATDANEHTTRFEDYDPSGYPRVIVDALGNRTRTTYDVRGNVTEVEEADGATTTQTYDVFARPLENRRPKDQQAGEFIVTPAPKYDVNDNTLVFTAPNGVSSSSEFDAADQLLKSSQPGDEEGAPARVSTFTYDKVGNQLTSTEPKGNLTEEPGDFTSTTRYDEVYQPIEAVNAAGRRASAVYNDVGDLVKVVDARKNETEDPDDYTTRFRYDLDHRLLETTDAIGKSTTSTYDWDGLTTATTDADGNRTELVIDARGALAEARVPHDDGVVRKTRFEYDEVGNRTRVVTPRGMETEDPEDFASETVYDELNRVKETLSPFDPDDDRYNTPDRTTYEYDALSRVKKVSAPPSEGQSVRNETEYTYFDTGLIRTSVDAFDIRNSYRYNDLGQQIQNTLSSAGDAVSRTLDSSFYPSGALKSRSDDGVPVGLQVALVDNSDINNTAQQGTWTTVTPEGAYGYDAQTHEPGTGEDRFVWQLTIPQAGDYTVYVRHPKVDGAAKDAAYEIKHKDGTETKTLDQSELPGEWRSLGKYAFAEDTGQAVTLTDKATGTVVADAVRLVRDYEGDTDNEKKDFSYRYDANGNQTEIVDNSPGVETDRYTLAYDELNQLTEVVERDGDTVRDTTALTYDANGNTLTTTHDLTWSKLEYDELDRVERITNAASPTADDRQVTSVEYTARGELAKQTKPNGNVLTVDYYLDGATKKTAERQSDDTLVAEHALKYNANGHKVEDVLKLMDADDNGSTIDNTYAYTYDPQDRIAKVAKTGDDEKTEEYRHDAAGNVVRQTVDDTTTTHRYDRNRLLTSTEDGASSTYNYDPLGRLDTVSFGGETIQKYRYDGFDRPESITSGTGDAARTTRLTYDAFDRTVKEAVGSGDDAKTTLFTYLGITSNSLREEVTDEGVTSFQYASWGQKLTQIKDEEDKDPETTQYLYHPHGDVEALTDKDGDTKTTYGYTAYGKNDTAQFTGADKPGVGGEEPSEPYNSYRFNSKRYDTASGTYDMGFRTYDPGLNRFLTRDMYGGALADMGLTMDPYTGNRYAFAGGNPISFIEIDGHLFGLSWSDIGHAALDVVGLIPVVGEAADLANCGWYAAEGEYVDAALSCASAIPFAGYGATAAKVAKYGDEALEALDTASDVGRNVPSGGATPPTGGVNPPPAGAADPPPAGAADAPPTGGANPPAADAPAPAAPKPPDAPPSCKNSFVPGTKVLMADGSTKAIEDIELGDKVTASDVETDDTQSRTVTRTIKGEGKKRLVTITVDTDGRSGDATSTITATDGHPFWLPDLAQWVDAGDLRRGQWLSTGSGSWIQITAVSTRTAVGPVHNLSVAGVHTYHVLAGSTPVLVHNCGLEDVAGSLGSRGPGDPTRGQVVNIADGGVSRVGQPIQSGRSGVTDDINDFLMGSPNIANPASGPHAAATHVETTVAWFMRQRGVTSADLVINHAGGPCRGPFSCTNAVGAILPQGSTLNVWFPNAAGGMSNVLLRGRA